MIVTATDLKTNLGKYLDLLDSEDIIITRNGRRIARLIRDEEDILAEVQSLYGILASAANDASPDKPVEGDERNDRIDRH